MEKISVLGLDIGLKRVGVAGCDGLGLIATGLDTIKRTSFVEDVAKLKKWVEEREATLLVIGLPYTMGGEIGSQARFVQKFADRLSVALELPLEYVDERLTSLEAEAQMLAQNISPSRNKGVIDRKAAAIILQQWLDQRRQKSHSRSAKPNLD